MIFEPFTAGPLVEHIPGAGIDFTIVGSVHVVAADQIGSGLPRSTFPGIRRAGPERLVPIFLDGVANDRVTVGDLLVTLSVTSTVRLGRPMQVVHRADDGMAVALDDSALPRTIKVGQSFVSAIEYGETATVWHVLTAFGIGRCPRCQSPGQPLMYGLPIGEPPADVVLGGCLVPHLTTDLTCPRCHAEWALPALPDAFAEARF